MQLLVRSMWMLASTAVAICAFASAAHADATVRAMWRVQEIHMPYFGITTQYSCDGLRDKLRGMLLQLGAREDVLVTVSCTEMTGPSKNPSVRIVLAHAVPANEDNKKAVADASREALVAKLKRTSKQTFSDEPFDAVTQRVELRSKGRGDASAVGDCELLEHIQRHVAPKIGAQLAGKRISCAPYQGTVGNPSLELDVLMPVKQ